MIMQLEARRGCEAACMYCNAMRDYHAERDELDRRECIQQKQLWDWAMEDDQLFWQHYNTQKHQGGWIRHKVMAPSSKKLEEYLTAITLAGTELIDQRERGPRAGIGGGIGETATAYRRHRRGGRDAGEPNSPRRRRRKRRKSERAKQ